MTEGGKNTQPIDLPGIPNSSSQTMRLSRQSTFTLLLYVIFPLFAGFVSAMQGSGRTNGWPVGFSIAYYIPLALITMGSCGLSSHLLSKPFKALRLPLWLLLVASVFVAGEIVKLYVTMIVPVFDKLLPSTVVGGRVAEFTFAGNMQAGIPTIITWVFLNMVAWYMFRIERFGYQPPDLGAGSTWLALVSGPESEVKTEGDVNKHSSATPNFMKRSNLTTVEQIKAIEAQQHYIKIYTDHGSKTVLYRFSDAINEIDNEQGLRVHRSWWVNKNSVISMDGEGIRVALLLDKEIRVPVSRTYYLRASELFGTH